MVVALVIDLSLKPVSPCFVGNAGAVVAATAAAMKGSCAGNFIAITVGLCIPIGLVDVLTFFIVIFLVQGLCHEIVSQSTIGGQMTGANYRPAYGTPKVAGRGCVSHHDSRPKKSRPKKAPI